MNFGTPQEILDEEREYYKSIDKKPPSFGCLNVFLITFLGTLIIIFL